MRAAMLLAMMAGTAWAAAPPARLTPAQAKLLRERPWFGVWPQSLEIELRVYGPWSRVVEKTADRLSDWHQERGEWAEEAGCRRRVVEARSRLDGDRHHRTVDARLMLAEALARRGRTPAQREALRRAQALDGQAVALYREGKAAKAVAPARQALAIYEALGERGRLYVMSLNNLAFLLQAMGDSKAALTHYEKVLAIKKDMLGERHPSYATSLDNLASLLRGVGDRKAALPHFQNALAIRKEALGESHPRYASSLNNLATLLKEMGDLKAALPLFQKALAIEETLGEKHPHYATSLNNFANLVHAMGDVKAALPLMRKALAIRKELLGEKHPDYAQSLNNLGNLLGAAGDGKAALPLYEKALDIVSSQLRGNASSQSDRQQLAAAAALRLYLDNRLTLPDLEGYPTAAAHVLAWKGTLLLRQQQRRLFLRLAAGPATRQAAERLQVATRQLAALRLSPTATRGRLAALEKEQDDAQAALSDLSAAFRQVRDKDRPSPEAMAAALPEGAVLVDYLFYRDRLAAFVHRRGKPAVRVELCETSGLEGLVEAWRVAIAGGKPDAKHGAALKKLVFSRLAEHLEGATTILVSPDGVLGLVPFAALPGKKEGTYLIEDVALAVVPVPSAVPDLVKPMPEKDRLAPSLLVVGGVDYDGGKAVPQLADSRSAPLAIPRSWRALPGSAEEADAVAKSFASAFKGGLVKLSGDKAASGAVRAGLEKARYAHLATHGFFASEIVKSAADLKGKDRLGEDRMPTGWHPLLLSGLAFSGANRAPSPGQEDGILTALEVSEMDLTKLELAVLSACETGLGKVAGGEGILGMQRAFQIAGARSVVASLWQVDDNATRQLMTDFYSIAWDAKKAVPLAEAMRKAQLAMLFGRTLDGKPRGLGAKPEKLPMGGDGRERTPPYYWAAFVLSGDWR